VSILSVTQLQRCGSSASQQSHTAICNSGPLLSFRIKLGPVTGVTDTESASQNVKWSENK